MAHEVESASAGVQRSPSALQAYFDRKARWHPLEWLFWLAWVAMPFVPQVNLVLLTHVLIWGLFAVSLDLVLGWRGIPTLGHAVFFGIGAYAAGFLNLWGWTEPLSGLLVCAGMAGVAGLMVGWFLRGIHGIAVLMVTLGLNMLLFDFVLRSTELTGGADGLQGISMPPLFGTWAFDMAGRTGYIYTLAVVFVCFCVVRAVTRSSFGLALLGAKENPRRMQALGAPVQRDVVLAFGISAAVAGVAGGLSTHMAQFVGAEVLSFNASADVTVMLVLGGAGTLYGGLLGSGVFLLMRDSLSTMDPLYWLFWIGLLLVVVVAVFRRGMLPTAQEWVARWTARRRKQGGK